MPVTVRIPTALRTYANGQARAEVQAKTVGEALQALVGAHPELRRHLFDEDGRLRSFVNVYVGDRDARELGGDAAPVQDGATLLLVPSVAGGAA